MSTPRPIVILGPTAGGKSELAVALAEQVRGEVLGADSMQVYRHMDAGTAKPSPALRQRVAHHLIDIVEPTQRFTVCDWLKRADALIEQLGNDGKIPILVGGTNLYIKALLEGLFVGPTMDGVLRAKLAAVPSAELHRRLSVADPRAAERIHPHDRKRLVRALEVYLVTGMPISQWQRQWGEGRPTRMDGRMADHGGHTPYQVPEVRRSWSATTSLDVGGSSSLEGNLASSSLYRHNPILIGLQWPVEQLNPRINLRVKAMFYPDQVEARFREQMNIAESLPEEARRLSRAGLLGSQARQALGYKQVMECMEGLCSPEEAFERTKILTRRFAKQQRAWLRRFRSVHWLGAAGRSTEQIVVELKNNLSL